MDLTRAVDKKILSVPVDLSSINWDQMIRSGGQMGNGKFVGVPHLRGGMRGAGIGGVLSTLVKLIPTFLASPVGQQLISTTQNIAKDVASGEPVLASAKKHARQAVRETTGLGKKHNPKIGNKRRGVTLETHLSKRKRTRRLVPFSS